ncbi:MAG: VCBS repeat-containing protein [Chloroflexi bacterium]|nr:VCBS repeat-containing protein [Chloroflexota bacterium]
MSRLLKGVALNAALLASVLFVALAYGSDGNAPNDPDFNRCGEAAPHQPFNPPPNPACSYFDEQWNLYSFFPRNAPNANLLKNENDPPLEGSGLSADLAWTVTKGDPSVVIAILDSGIRWDDRELANKLFLNRGELPLPDGCADYDCNGDGAFNVRDYASSVSDAGGNGNGILDSEDLILTFSNGIDEDNNGYVDDISGWDFFRDDNDPLDEVHFNHGTGRAKEAAAESDNRIARAGVCQLCTIMPLRIGDSFVVNVHARNQGIVYAVDNGVSIASEAIGAVNSDAFSQQVMDYAWENGVLIILSAADEDSFHHNQPAALNHGLWVKSIIPDVLDDRLEQTKTFLNHAFCTNYGGHNHLAVPTTSCSSGATGNSAGVAGLVYSAGKQFGYDLTADEVKQIVTLAADDINIPGSGIIDKTKYPSQPGWDQYFGYGRINAYKAVMAVAEGLIPPEADIISPEWFDLIDPLDTPTVSITGTVGAPRAGFAAYRVQCGLGVEPLDGEFVTIHTSSSPPSGDVLATWNVLEDCLPPDFDDPPARNPAVDPPDADPTFTLHDDFTVTLRVQALDDRGLLGEDRKTVAVHHDPDLLPAFPLDLPGSGEPSIALVDLDGNNDLEIVEALGDGRVYAFHHDGSAVSGFPVSADPVPALDPANPANHLSAPAYARGAVTASPDSFASPLAVGDLFRDGRQVIVAGSVSGRLYAWFADGSRLPGFPVSVDAALSANPAPDFEPAHGIGGSPALGNLDGDPELEIVVSATDQHLYAWNPDGSFVSSFNGGEPLLLNQPDPNNFGPDDEGENKILSSPAIGDVDNDGLAEMVVGTNEAFDDPPSGIVNGSGRVYVVSNLGEVQAVLRVDSAIVPNPLPLVGNGVPISPALADLDGDGDLEIAVATIGTQPGLHTVIFHHDGTPFAVQPQAAPFGSASDSGLASGLPPDEPFHAGFGNPSFSDLTGDGRPEFILGGLGSRVLIRSAAPSNRLDHDHLFGVWDVASGQFLPSFPRRVEDWQFFTNPTVADLDGDGLPEAVNGTGGYLLDAFNALGLQPQGWPKFTNGWLVFGSALGDIDNDGDLEVAYTTREGKLFVWGTAGDVCGNTEWWKFHHDEWNTGLYGFDTRPPSAVRDLTLDATATVSGGGTIVLGSGKANFGLNVKYRNGAVDGQLLFDDHANGLRVKSDNVNVLLSARGLTLRWTAPGDDGPCGQAQRYEIRFATFPITESNWSQANPINGEPTPQSAGTQEGFVLPAMAPGTYYFAVRAVDDKGNPGALSNMVTATVLDIVANQAVIRGTAALNGVPGQPFTITVVDNGEPGAGTDSFRISLTGYGAGGVLEGGNIQVLRAPDFQSGSEMVVLWKLLFSLEDVLFLLE